MMNFIQACGVVAKQRPQDSLLVATMGAMFIFDRIEGEDGQATGVPLAGGKAGLVMGIVAGKLSQAVSKVAGKFSSGDDKPKPVPRLNSVPLMGGAAGLALGLAMAQPERRVIVVDGDASLLMELSGMVTVARQAPGNFLHIVIHNDSQFTGLDNMKTLASGYNFADAARVAGYTHTEVISDGGKWAERFPALLAMTGPVFVELMVDPIPKQTKDGFVQQELPPNQYDRMGVEALAMQARLLED